MSVSFDGIMSKASHLATDIADATVDLASSIVDHDANDKQNEKEFIFSEMIGITIKFHSLLNIPSNYNHHELFIISEIEEETKQTRTFKIDNKNDNSTIELHDTVSFIVKQKPSTIKFSLYEYHKLTKNKLIGSVNLTLEDTKNTKENKNNDNDENKKSPTLNIGNNNNSSDHNKNDIKSPTSNIPIATNNATNPNTELKNSSSPSPPPVSSSIRQSFTKTLIFAGDSSIQFDCTIFINSIPNIIGRSSDEVNSHTSIDSLLSLIDLKIIKAENLKRETFIFPNSAFVIVNYGELSYRTHTVARNNSPTFDQFCPIWMKKESKNFMMNFSVWHHSKRKPKLIGNAFLPIHLLKPSNHYQFTLPLVEDEPRTDAELKTLLTTMKFDPELSNNLNNNNNDSHHHTHLNDILSPSPNNGTLTIELIIRPREQVEEKFYDQLISTYDSDHDKTLDEGEIFHLCQTIQSNITDEEIHTAIIDTMKQTHDNSSNNTNNNNKDEIIKLNKSDLSKLFRHQLFQKYDFLLTLHAVMIHGNDAIQNLMMKNFFFKQKKKTKLADKNDSSSGSSDNDSSSNDKDPLSVSDNDSVKIFVIDRESGMTVKEEIPEYIRACMRMLYRSRGGRLLSSRQRVQNTLKSLTIKQGIKMNSELSAKQIPIFIKLHHINIEEIEKPINQYKTFNEFFARKMKPGVRECEEPNNASIAVSPADCRLSVFQTIDESKKLWIKGTEFNVQNLLGPADKTGELTERFNGGSLVIARLAPQDYHRWHHPVDGISQLRTMIDGEYNTVSPIAVRKNVNVYTDNHRCVCPIQTKEFGLVILVAIAASMVGSIQFIQCKCHDNNNIINNSDPGKVPEHIIPPACSDGKCQVGSLVSRFDEHGYFAFGGSTVLILFEPGRIAFDSDLKHNSDRSIETLIKVGRRIGRATKEFAD